MIVATSKHLGATNTKGSRIQIRVTPPGGEPVKFVYPWDWGLNSLKELSAKHAPEVLCQHFDIETILSLKLVWYGDELLWILVSENNIGSFFNKSVINE